jgi:mitochondrial translocator assembly and maintenance protein 41
MIHDSSNNIKDNNDDNDDGLLTSQNALRRLLDDTLPHQQEIVFAFGYGSGVVSQEQSPRKNGSANGDDNKKMVDLIVVVKDAFKFHEANYQANPSHYWIPPAPTRRFFMTPWSSNKNNDASTLPSSSSTASIAQWCTWWQRHEAPCSLFQKKQKTTSWLQNPGVYYNIVVSQHQQQQPLKYGVVQADDLLDDLKMWKYLYLAGRMHKPLVPIILTQKEENDHDEFMMIAQAQQDNLMAALSTSLLLLSEPSSTSSSSSPSSCIINLPSAMIFRQVAALSYAGDFRMSYAEDPNKIDKLVQGGSSSTGSSNSSGQLHRFESLYHHAASQLVQNGVLSTTRSSSSGNKSSSLMWSWDASSPTARQLLWSKLPLRLQQQQNDDSSSKTTRLNHCDSSEWLSPQLASIVAPAARYQSFKGIVTAGPRKACIYAARKVAKRFSWRK